MNQKIIVTGGTGYIGSHTVVELIENNFDVVIADNLCNSGISMLDNIAEITGTKPEFVQVDLSDAAASKDFYSSHKDAVAVINFAALKAVGESVQMPIEYYSNNLNILLNTLNYMKAFEIPNLIFSSSATVYGLPKSLPLTEDAPTQRGMSPYGNSKKVGEEIIEDVTKSTEKINAISLRYFNPIGAHSSKLIGELPNGIPNNLMPFITQTAAGIRKELKVFGNDYGTEDGTAVRDYIHVVDLAKAHVAALNRLLNGSSDSQFEIFNLGTGTGYSVLDVIHSFEKTNNLSLNYSFAPRRDGDVPAMYANADKANNALNWEAELNLDEMTHSSWEWEKQVRNINE